MTHQKALVLFVVATSAMFSGCIETHRSVSDALWEKNELRLIRHTEHRVFAIYSTGKITSQKWELTTIPYPNQSGHFTKKRTLMSVNGAPHHAFWSIQDSDLLIHETASQFTIFDPKTSRDVSAPFPAKPVEGYWFNRSRTACLILAEDQTVILDTLSAKLGEPKVLSRPAWAKNLRRLVSGQYNRRYANAVLTEDASRLVLRPDYGNYGGVWPPNFDGEIWQTKSSVVEKFTIPIELRKGGIVDAELIDGEVLLIWRNYLSKEGVDGVKLVNTRGEILCSGMISPHTDGQLWNIKSPQILFPYYTGSGLDGELWQTYYLWNYQSNSMQRIRL